MCLETVGKLEIYLVVRTLSVAVGIVAIFGIGHKYIHDQYIFVYKTKQLCAKYTRFGY